MHPFLDHYTSGDWVLIIGAASAGIAAVIGAIFTGMLSIRQIPRVHRAMAAQTQAAEERGVEAKGAVVEAKEAAVEAKDAAVEATATATVRNEIIAELLDALKTSRPKLDE